MLYGCEETWEPKTIAQFIKTDHGYTASSEAVQWLLEIISSYSKHKKSKFVQFITGSPRLPMGGLSSLVPPLTIVKKLPEVGHQPDEFLPSVMTCTTYLKLPEYSSKKVMEKRMDFAINEGNFSFHLS